MNTLIVPTVASAGVDVGLVTAALKDTKPSLVGGSLSGSNTKKAVEREMRVAIANAKPSAYVELRDHEFLRSMKVNTYLNAFLNELNVGMVAGGFVLSLLRPDIPYSDIDLFFASAADFSTAFAKLTGGHGVLSGYAPLGGSYGYILQKHHVMPVITLVKQGHPNIQLIKIKWYESPMHLLDGFDISVAQFCIDLSKKTMVYAADSLIQLVSNMAIIKCAAFPADLACRLVKYTKKGFEFDEADIRDVFSRLSGKAPSLRELHLAVNY